jgi:hypothetical protein
MRHRQCQWGASNRITEDQTRRDATKRHATKRRRTPAAGRWDPAGDAMAAGGRGRKPASHPIPGEIKRLIPFVQNAAIELKLAGRRLPRSAECKFMAARTAIPRMSSRSLQPGVCRACDAPTARAVFNGRVTRRPKERGESGEESGDDAWWKPQYYVKLTCQAPARRCAGCVRY